ncbi:apolipoprotein N-acyltransferase [Pseudothermotoga thermarum]|uniref:Apolipoprotein N-acyltransferase n=1 Tax=Pseudothermotoga thermarum DSM 5069 TaxID=688269 RepID=F7YUD3_9THEM|nr:apolipoprotein N-acyltransferase [Pseudothermotoga thermarum]AEH51332.1 apolipoprotein N-acyltransferase [Pseudothermotoga thermarum DSM 5069]
MIFLVVSAVLTALSMPGFLLGILVWFSLVFLFKSLENKGPFFGALYGFLFYYIFCVINLFWVLPVLTENLPKVFGRFPSWLGFFVFLLMCAIEALPFAGFGLIYGFMERFIKTNPYKEILFTASLYTLFDYLRGIGQMGFTGGTLSDALYKDVGILQLASIIGPYGLTFLIVAFNCWLYINWRRSLKPLEKLIFYVLIVIAISHVVAAFLPFPVTSEKAIVSVQTNVKQDEKYSTDAFTLAQRYLDLVLGFQDLLVVFPEETFTNDIRGGAVERLFVDTARETNLKFLIGFPTFEGDGYKNSAVLLSSAGVVDQYSKVILFPFVEMLPYPRFFRVFGFLRGLEYLKPGQDFKPLVLPDYPPLGVQICFESYFSKPSRELVKNGAEVLLVCTNDGWFAYNVALKQHFAKAVMRAVENRRQVIQVSNAGITGMIDPYGRILKIVPLRKELAAKFELIPNDTVTIYCRIGDVIIWLCVGILIVVLLLPRRQYVKSERRIFLR